MCLADATKPITINVIGKPKATPAIQPFPTCPMITINAPAEDVMPAMAWSLVDCALGEAMRADRLTVSDPVENQA